MSFNERVLPRPALVYSSSTVWLLGVCFIFSGATGLIYEVLWARMLGLVFGATTLAVSTVLAAFMAGLALGSVLAGRWSSRIRRPFRLYGLFELGIAVYAVLVPLLFSWVDKIYAVVWQQLHPGFFAFSVWRFVLSSMVLLLPTTLMGATLPVLAAALLASPGYRANSVTRLYGCNLAGAILGTLAAGFFLLPNFGLRATIFIAAAINVFVGAVAVLADRKQEPAIADSEISADSGVTGSESPPALAEAGGAGAKFWLCCALVSGFVTISTQVAWTRVLTMIIGSSTYAFSIVVALFLAGLAMGAWLVGRKDYSGQLRFAILKVEIVTAISLLLSLYLTNGMPDMLVGIGLRLSINSWPALLGLQVFCAAFLILLPALLMGTVMPLVLVWAGRHTSNSVRLVGRAYAVNTIGAIAGAFAAGFILVPKASVRMTILFAATLCLVVAGLAYEPEEKAKDRDLKRSLSVGATAVAISILFASAPSMNLSALSIGAYDSLVRVLARARGLAAEDNQNRQASDTHILLMYQEGPTSSVSVRKDWDITSLAINGRTNASDREDMPTQVMLAQLPLLLAPNVGNALVVGFATGVSAGTILQSPMESVTCVEIEPATIPASHFFDHVNNKPLSDPRFHLVIDDARNYLGVNGARYDVIMSEPSHPWVPGVANLFTEEFFRLGRTRLADGGVFVQWLQIYQLSVESLQSVLATYSRVFPHVMVFRVGGVSKGKDLILVGSDRPLTLDRVGERMLDSRIAAELGRVGMTTEAEVRSWYVCNEDQLGPAVGGAVINTDDNMHIETSVPREAFRPLMQSNAAWIESLAKQPGR